MAILLGGTLGATRWAAAYVFRAYTDSEGKNFYSDSLALLGALLLGTPIVVHAFKNSLVTHHFPLKEINAAFRTFADKEHTGCIKAIIHP